MAAVRVVIVDDEYLVRSGLRLILDGAADLDVVGEGATGREAIELVTDLNPDVVCMDIRMPVMDGIAATRALDTSRTAVLILTAFDTEDFILDALDAGASGFLLKDTPPPNWSMPCAERPPGNTASRRPCSPDWSPSQAVSADPRACGLRIGRPP